MVSRKPLSTSLLVGLLLMVVGLGNVWVGTAKSASSSETLMQMEVRLKNSPNASPSDTAIHKKAIARKEYYQIVKAGGMALLFAGISLVLVELLRPPRTRAEAPPPQDHPTP